MEADLWTIRNQIGRVVNSTNRIRKPTRLEDQTFLYIRPRPVTFLALFVAHRCGKLLSPCTAYHIRLQ